jgi:osmotically-inducible protein OsmY
MRDDTAIRAEVVEGVLLETMLVEPGRVDVEVADGVVTLTGDLGTDRDAELAVRFVERVEGVVGVVDRLRRRSVRPASLTVVSGDAEPGGSPAGVP